MVKSKTSVVCVEGNVGTGEDVISMAWVLLCRVGHPIMATALDELRSSIEGGGGQIQKYITQNKTET